MERQTAILLVIMPLLAACSDSTGARETSGTSSLAIAAPSSAEGEKQTYLREVVRADTIRHSFHAAEGMWVDCVDVARQPSMLTSEMSGSRIDTPPPLPTNRDGAITKPAPGWTPAQLDVELHVNESDENGHIRHCEPGTIPIRRTTAEELARYSSLRDYMKVHGNGGHVRRQVSDPYNISGYQYATQYQDVTNWGMQLFLNIWEPSLGSTGIHSLSQMWVANNVFLPTTETAEAGLTVDYSRFHDYHNHLFVSWTDDDYATTGCVNLACPGFVQTNNSVTLGAYYNPASASGGVQQWVELSWVKSSSTANWWLLYQGTTWVGYYPASQYHHGMQTQASTTQYGGEVHISQPNGNPPPQMGSGALPSTGAGYAAFQAHLQYVNTNYNTIDVSPENDSLSITSPNCYSLTSGYQTGSGWYWATQTVPVPGYFQYFGGSGCE